jgi:hypothetical protein
MVFEVSTDGSGNIEWWVIQLVANSCLSADVCGIVTVHTLMSGDGGQIILPTATTVQGYVKDKPGAWIGELGLREAAGRISELARHPHYNGGFFDGAIRSR